MLDVLRKEIRKQLLRFWPGMSLLAKVAAPQDRWQVDITFISVPLPPMTARIAQPGWAIGTQATAPLQVGDEVMVVFPDGDLSGQPVVTHRLFNGKDLPPNADPGEFVLEFRDSGGSFQGRLRRKSDGGFQLDALGLLEVRQVSAEDAPEMKIQIDPDNGRIYLHAPGKKIELDADQIYLGNQDDATEGVPLGTTLKTWLDGHVHTDSVGGSTSTPTTGSPAPSSVAQVKA